MGNHCEGTIMSASQDEGRAVAISPAANGGRYRTIICFSFALVAACLCRGVILCCIVPPIAMWDEFQHVGRIAFLHENGRAPVFNEDRVPVSVIQQAVRFPCVKDTQLLASNGWDFDRYWLFREQPKLNPQAPPPPLLYEAQQGPLYYWLMLPIFNLAGGTNDLAVTVSVLRLMNVAFAAAALAVVMVWAARAVRQRQHAMLIGLWAGLPPLVLLNCTRVANDALPYLLATIVVAWCLRLKGRRLLWHAAAIGLVSGLGILTKATDMALIPFVLLCLPALAWRRETKWWTAAAAAAIFLLVVAAVISWSIIDSFHQYGVPFPVHEAIDARARGVKLPALLVWLEPAHWCDWLGYFRNWFLDSGLWVGGWSFLLPPQSLIVVYEVLLSAAVLGWPLAWLFRRQRWGVSTVFHQAWMAPALIVFFLCVLAGMMAKGVESLAAWGECSIMSWYAAPALPWILAVLASSALALRHSRLGYTAALIMPAFFVVVEFLNESGQMATHYSQNTLSLTALRRLGSLHPVWLRWPTLLTVTLLATVFLAAAFGLCVAAIYRRHHAKRFGFIAAFLTTLLIAASVYAATVVFVTPYPPLQDNSVMPDLAAVPSTAVVHLLTLENIGPVPLRGLFVHGGNSVRVAMTPRAATMSLRVGLEPAAEIMCDGVRFLIAVDDGRSTHVVLDRVVCPKDNPADCGFPAATADFSAYVGHPVTVIWTVQPVVGTAYNWAVFLDPQWTP